MLFAADSKDFVFGTDALSTEPNERFAASIASYLMFTHAEVGYEYVSLSAFTTTLLARLLPLCVTNDRLYDRIWNSNQGCLTVGVGKIAEEAYIISQRLDRNASVNDTLQRAIAKLRGESKRAFEEVRNKLEGGVLSSIIYDLSRQRFFTDYEPVQLIGMLKYIPTCLLAEVPFTGYITAYGMGVKFVSHAGALIEWVPFSTWYVREAIYNFHAEVIDDQKSNQTSFDLFNQLFIDAENRYTTEIAMGDVSPSLLEDIKLSLYTDYGVALEVMPKRYLADKTFDLSTSKKVQMDHSVKIGLQEAVNIHKTIKLLPPGLLQSVKSIAKFKVSRLDLRVFMNDVLTVGTYTPHTKLISLFESDDVLYNRQSKLYQISMSFTLVHEIGEAVWTMLTKKEQSVWKKFSWKGKQRIVSHEYFLTWYSHMVDERDDFCEHFACYVFHADEFRERAEASSPLQQKYDFIKSVFEKYGGQAIEYPEILRYSIADLHGALVQEVKKKRLEEAMELIDLAIEQENESFLDKQNDVIHSFEDLYEHELEQIQNEDADTDDSY